MSAYKVFGIALMLSMQLSCSSYRKVGDEHMEAKEYIAAEHAYTQALEEDPNDSRALAGLRRARTAIMGERLIGIRQMRLSGNVNGAIAELKDVVRLQSKWKLAPSGVAFSTQVEEQRALFRFHIQAVRHHLSKGHAFPAYKLMVERSEVFENGPTLKEFASWENEVKKVGLSTCTKVQGESTGYYSEKFAEKICLFWGAKDVEVRRDIASTTMGEGHPLISSIEITGEVEGLSQESLKMVQNTWLNAIQASPYFSTKGNKLTIDLNGKFTVDGESRNVILQHVYSVRVPYQAVVTVPYFESVPYTDYQQEYDYVSGLTFSRPVTRYRQVTNFRNEMVTQYRTENRSLPYQATEFETSYFVSLRSTAVLDDLQIDHPHTDSKIQTGVYHENNNPDIGLEPAPLNIQSPVSWLDEELTELELTMISILSAHWERKYCLPLLSKSESSTVEQLFRCRAGAENKKRYTESWLSSKFGISESDLTSLIGQLDK